MANEHMARPDVLLARRALGWRQAPDVRLTTPDDAAAFIQHVGIATLYPASPEFPDIFRAFMGRPDATTDLDWDGTTHLPTTSWQSPSSEIYTWRWQLGHRDDLYYGTLIRKRPTWVSHELIAPVLALRGDMRAPDELYAAGLISAPAHRITQVLQEATELLTTGALRKHADFPTGKEQRTAYQHAISELEERLIICKVFVPGQEDMGHALTATRYAEQMEAAAQLTPAMALTQIVQRYLPAASLIKPALFARHMKIKEADLLVVLHTLTDAGAVRQIDATTWASATLD